MAAIRDGYRRWIVVLSDEDVTVTAVDEIVIHSRQIIWVDVDKDTDRKS